MKYIFMALLFLTTFTYSNELKKVSLQLQWKYQFQFAGFIMAKEKGFYKDIGLDVQIKEFNPSIDTVKDLLSNKTEYSMLNTPFIYKNKKLEKTMLLASYFQKNPLVFAVQENISNPSQLKNKIIMGTADDLRNSALALMLNHFDISTKNSTFKAQTFSMNDFIEKKVDAVTAFRSNELYELDKKGIKYNILDPYDYGFFTTATNLFTTYDYASKNTQEVKQFLNASKKGWEYSLNNIEEVSKIIYDKYKTKKSIEALIYEAKVTKKLMLTELYDIGEINNDLINRAYNQLVKTGILLANQKLENLTINGLIKKESEQKINLTKEEKEYLKKKKEITMCIDPNWLPFEKLDKNSKYIGMSADYFKLFQEQLDIPIKLIKTKTWSDSLESAKKRECDILSLAMKTPKRKEYLNFTSPYLKIPLVIATKTDVPFIDNIKSIEDKKLAITKAYAFAEILKNEYPNMNIVEVENIEEGLKKVNQGKVFGYIGTLASIGYKFQTQFNGELKIAGKFYNKWELGIAVRNDDDLLLEILDKVVNSVDEKQRQEILNAWVSINYEKKVDYTLILQILFISAIIILIFIYWNIKLSKAKKQIELANKKVEKYIKMIDTNVLISLSDTKGIITDVSNALCKLTGYTKSELIGQNHNIFRHKDMDSSAFRDMWEVLSLGDTWQGEVKNLNKDGSYYWANVIISPSYNEKNKLTGYSAIRQNISDKKELERISVTDTLTKIYNRLYLDRNYAYEMQRTKRYKHELSIILIDIDFFKKINDNYGHNIGDIVLIEIANILKQNIRNSDKLGRWGGEEFLIICPETNYENAQILAENLRITIENHIFTEVGNITCSFGITKYYADDKKDEAFIRADKALYIAKEEGRNRVIINI